MLLLITIALYLLISLFFIGVIILIIQCIYSFCIWLNSDKTSLPSNPRTLFPKDLNKIRHWHLYVLKLENNKYYVGITAKSPEIRMQEHKNRSRSSYWTAFYKPLEIICSEDLGYITETIAMNKENKAVRDYMRKYGLNNVRGGDLTSTENYIQRFGYIMIKDSYLGLIGIIGLILINIYFMINVFFL